MQPPGGKRSYESIVTDLLKQLQATGVLTDVNPGSVVRTLTEAFAREMAEAYARLAVVYEMGFIDTATGESLDYLVALLGQQRVDGLQVIGEAVFERDPRVAGRAVIPAGTALTIANKSYVTMHEAQLQAGQPTVTVQIRADVPAGKKPEDYVLLPEEVGPATLTYLLAGVAGVSIARPTALRGHRESDEDLRKRVKGLLAAAGGGTRKAMERALLATGKVTGVAFRDATSPGLPKLQPGELEVIVDADIQDTPTYNLIRAAIDETKGPGILVRTSNIVTRTISFDVKVALTSPNLSVDKRQAIRRAVEATVQAAVEALGVGQKLLWNPVQAKVLSIDGVLDIVRAQARVGNSLLEALPREIPSDGFSPTERLVPLSEGPTVVVTFADELRVFVRLKAAAPTALSPDVQAAAVRALEELLAGKGENARLTYEELIETVQGSHSALAAIPFVFELTDEAGGGQKPLTQAGDAYTTGPDQVFYPDLRGPDWGETE